jgi:adenylate cyclase
MAQRGQDETPNITLIEDLHWIDAGSESFLEQLVTAFEGTRSLLLVNFRPEYHADWMQRSWYRQLPIAPLGPEAIRELLDDLLGRDPSVAGLAERIHERTGGNPFFTEEVVLALIESGALEGTRGAHRLVTPVEELAIPASVHTLLASRIDRLGEREKRVLQTASVIGKTFAEPLLAAVADVPANELAEALARLKSAEFVHEDSLYPVARYAFKHPLTQAVAQDSLLRERRRELHGRVGRALEAASQESLDETAALLAHHFEEAGEAWEAARWHDRAAGWVRKTDIAEALRHWEQTLFLLERVEDSDEAARLGVDARTGALQVAWRVALPPERCDRLFEDGLELVRRLGDPRLEALLQLPYAVCVSREHEERRYEHSGRALEIARKLGSRELEVIALVVYGSSLQELGRVTEALDALDPLIESPPEDLDLGSDYWGFHAFGFLVGLHAIFLAMAGRMEESQRAAARAIELARGWGTLESIILMENDASQCAALVGDATQALAHARRAAEAAERFGASTYILVASTSLAWAEILSENWQAAAATLERVRQGMQRSLVAIGMVSQLEIEAALGAGDLDAALRLAEEAVEHSAASLPTHAWVKTLRACVGVRAGAPRAPLEAFLDEAAALLVESGAPAYAPRVHEVRAELLAREGDAEGADRELREALRRYQEMGATGHAERLARELGS